MWALSRILKMFGPVGSILPQITKYAVIALVAILISYGLIQYGKNIEHQNTVIEQSNNYIDTRGRIDDATQTNPTSNPTTALDNLRRMLTTDK